MTIALDPTYHWQKLTLGDLSCHYIGEETPVRILAERLALLKTIGKADIARLFESVAGRFAIIAETPRFCFACTDRIRAYPVYYCRGKEGVAFSNSARKLAKECGPFEWDDLSRLELSMAGYVTGRETLCRHLFQLQAAECVWQNDDGAPESERHFRYGVADKSPAKKEELIVRQGQITDAVFRRLLSRAAGRPIWVPLSGGLDSRLILAKLKEFKYDDVTAFSYGLPGNAEAEIAETVAKKLGVRWISVPSERARIKNYFWSEARRKYWEFADGLHVVPNIHWIDATEQLITQRLVPENAIFMNGQSGDFVQGAHIPRLNPLSGNFDSTMLLRAILEKHYALDNALLSEKNLNPIRKKISDIFTAGFSAETMDYEGFARRYESWEWQERQCKRVVNGQRTYDYYGFSWMLPLWDDDYVAFWDSVPTRLKMGRSLFLKYVEETDKFGVFRGFKTEVQRFSGLMKSALFAGKAVKLLLGSAAGEKFYRYLDYFSHYGALYAPFTYREYVRHAAHLRGPLPYFGKVYAEEFLREKVLSCSS